MANKKGEKYECEDCGLVVIVDEPCGCETTELICCGAPMKPVKAAKAKPKAKAAAKAKPKPKAKAKAKAKTAKAKPKPKKTAKK